MTLIVNPLYAPPDELRAALQEDHKSFILHKRHTIDAHNRRKISERIAEDAVEALFVPTKERIVNANALRRNQPGYDYLLDDKVKIQVKGNTWAEMVQFVHKGDDPSLPCLDYDVIIVVDIGSILESNFGKLEKYNLKANDHVDFYIFPRAIVLSQLKFSMINQARIYVYYYKYPLNPTTKECQKQFLDFPTYRNRFDILNSIL